MYTAVSVAYVDYNPTQFETLRNKFLSRVSIEVSRP
jgi:hypothetical protein